MCKCPFEFCATCGFQSDGLLKWSKCIAKYYLLLQPSGNEFKFICPKGYYPDDSQSVPICSLCQPLCSNVQVFLIVKNVSLVTIFSPGALI